MFFYPVKNMIYKAFKRLSELRVRQLRELEQACLKKDSVFYSVFSDPMYNFTSTEPAFFFALSGDRMVGAVTLFLPGDGSAEISALVAPEYRKQGIFKALLKQAHLTLKSLKCNQVLLAVTPGISATDAVLKKMKCKLDTSEYMMLLPKNTYTGTVTDACVKSRNDCRPMLVAATKKDIPELAQMNVDFFDNDYEFAIDTIEGFMEEELVHKYLLRVGKTNVGCGFFCLSKDCCSLFGIGVKSEFRGKGYGKALMALLLSAAPSNLPVVLHVSSHNAAAFSIYRSLGFEITAQQDFYLLK